MKKYLVLLLMLVLSCWSVFAAVQKEIRAGEYVTQTINLRAYKDISKRFLVINKLKQQTKNLSDADKNVIKKYVFGAVRGENTFLLINSYLRGNMQMYIPQKEITKPLKSRMDYYARTLNSVISKARLPQNMLLYAGMTEKDMEAVFADKKIDSVIKTELSDKNLTILKDKIKNEKFDENAFIVAYYDKNFVPKTKFMFEISAPKNLQVVSMEELDKKRAKEVVINKQATWKITDINIDSNKNGKYYRIKIKFVK